MNSRLLNMASELFCGLTFAYHFWQSFTSLLNSSATKLLENPGQGAYVLLLREILPYTSPHPRYHLRRHRGCTRCVPVMDAHKHVQIEPRSLPGSFPFPGFCVSSVLAPTEIVYLPTCQPHQIFTSLVEHTPSSHTSLSQPLAVLH